MTSPAVLAVKTYLNFAAGPGANDVWSNEDPSITQQNLRSEEVEIHDARGLARPAWLEAEGLTLVGDPLADPRWDDPDWLSQVYTPACARLVQRITGAAAAAPYYRGAVLVRNAARAEGKGAPPAQFVHLDQTPDSAVPLIREAFDEDTLKRYPHAVIFNVWRCLSAPPQNTPLAICDQRGVDRSQFASGRTISSKFPQGTPYLAALYSEAHSWYYFPSVGPDEAIVFKGLDLDLTKPSGCLHSAFEVPNPVEGAPMRRSIETRVVALFPH